jgi:methylenetetrahydrofolate dehydrogenase (NADP+)/methenyltetrahydrofolate cyclohydrolase
MTLAKRIDGKTISAALEADLTQEVATLAPDAGRPPGLAVIIAGADPASELYVKRKIEACGRVGVRSFDFHLPPTATQADVLAVVQQLNDDPNVDGILVQLPLPGGVDSDAILSTIRPDKDVDGFHPINLGNLLIGRPGLTPATPTGVMELLKRYEIPLAGKDAVVIGRSVIVGKPMAMLLTNADATVTLCHSRTRDLADKIRAADLVVAAVGRPHMVTPDMIKPGAVVIDVGTNRLPDGKLAGDVHPDVANVAGWLTPVPGGVGPMTIGILLMNTVKAYRVHIAKPSAV